MRRTPQTIILLFLIAAAVAVPGRGQDYKPHVAYIEHFLRNYPERKEQALKLVPIIEKYATAHNIKPLTVSVVISVESSFKTNVTGFAVGEIGLMQVHGICARGRDLSTADGQIEAGVSCLAMARESCDGSLKQMLTMYASGSCIARTKRTRWMIQRRLRIIKKWANSQRPGFTAEPRED